MIRLKEVRSDHVEEKGESSRAGRGRRPRSCSGRGLALAEPQHAKPSEGWLGLGRRHTDRDRRRLLSRVRLGSRERLFAAVAATVVPGVAVAGWSVTRLVEGDWRPGLVWLAALAAATAAEALPVPIEGVGAGTTSFATVFIAATAAELGPEASASLAALAILVAHMRRNMPPIRRIYNVCLYCLAGAAAGFAALAAPDSWSAGGWPPP